ANVTGLQIQVSHFPPGTSKWNKIEHRMFSFITQNWRGRPLISYQTIVDLIAHTKTKTGLKIKARLTRRHYPTGIEREDSEMEKCISSRLFFIRTGTTLSFLSAVKLSRLFVRGPLAFQ